jgi:hypothetical protein
MEFVKALSACGCNKKLGEFLKKIDKNESEY